MAWLSLLLAGLFEIGFTTAMRYTHGFTRLWPSLVFALCILLSFYFLDRSIKTIPLGTAYAVWTGIGAAGTVLIGVLAFHEPVTAWRLLFLVTLIASVAGLKLVSGH